ncbi:hypothetical protein E1262_02375 [Jiangella aurantiaca]|uniref:HTH luxR-type domain-containing protein n=1 Tax=Jiangella aurantiaca TaxID=2530373 RepID=A0A4R5AIW3_9ACTN|nr:LuxR C-terminal-related transcriptional regulator [Jiangella aurantiaca]TDD72718.1 hypothetical protein E1262_02375 [Jiangella aurantiaca]
MAGHDGGLAEQLARNGVTEREAEVLAAVSERLRNRAIAERLHISVRTVESHIAALMRKFGVTDRAALGEIGVELRRSAVLDITLPAPLTSLVGRADELAELTVLGGAHRLVTLIGPAGVGKTRLALHVASQQAASAPDGVRLADLAPVGPELVGDTVARALGVVPQPGWPLRDVLRETAGGMRGLLVVDNCEHVIAEAAEIVTDLLTAGSLLRVIATSREPLGVPGEVSYQLHPLPVPDPPAASSADTAGTYDAVRLFVDRAATAAPGFTLTDANAASVAALCQRLDGLPLAIELAASRVRSFDPADLVEHLDQRFELLSAGSRTALPRQQTLRGAIDWSYDLLDDAERALFDRLGVFPADFDYAAVEAVCWADAPGAAAVITLLPALVDKSLVTAVGRDGRRYRLLETIRLYAAERLTASGAEAGTWQRHASHYLAFAEHAAQWLRTMEQRAWLDRLTTEQPNLRAALDRRIVDGDIESAWRWIAALERFWDVSGQRREAQEWIQRALALGRPPATRQVVAGVAAASALLQPTDARAAFDLADKAVDLAVDLDDLTRARAARAVGMGAIWVQAERVLPALNDALALFGEHHPWETALTMQGLAQASRDLSEAIDWGRRSVALFRSVGDQMYAANALFIMAQRAMYAGVADDEVEAWLSESRALAEAAGSEGDETHATVGFGQLEWLRGNHDRATDLMAGCLPTLRRLGDQRCTGRALYVLGERAYERGDLGSAEQHLAASIGAITLAGQSFVLVRALESLAAVLADQGRRRHAAVLLGAAHTARDSASTHMRPVQPPDDDLRRSLVRQLGPAGFDAAHREGECLSPTQALQAISDQRDLPAHGPA